MAAAGRVEQPAHCNRGNLLGRTLETGVAHRVQRFRDGNGRCLGRDARREILTRYVEGALAGVGIGAIQHPTMLLAFSDGAGLL
jgi:hypothetical protein